MMARKIYKKFKVKNADGVVFEITAKNKEKLKKMLDRGCKVIEEQKRTDKDFEKVPWLIIYKQGDGIYAEEPEIINKFELFGFLKILIKLKEEALAEEVFDDSVKENSKCQ